VYLLVLIFIVVPIAELYVIIRVGEAIGVVPTLLLLVADAVLGSMLLRHQGRAAWVRFNRALAENRLPHREVFDGVLIIFGGALLMTPGFITDVFGLIFLIPPKRALVRAFTTRIVARRLAAGQRVAYWGFDRARERRRGRQPPPSTGPGAAPGGPGAPGGPPPPGADPFGWEDALFPGRARRGAPREGDIEGTGEEIRDEDELPPPREEPPAG
jgi:UPF0716 protein FxsA